MKKIKKFLLSMLIVSSTLCGAACKEKEVLMQADVPDYSNFTDQFDFYGYHSVHNGIVYHDGAPTQLGPREEFLCEEQYQYYKDVGMNIVYPQSILKIDSKYADGGREGSWEVARKEIDKFVAMGLDRVVLYDEDLSWLGLKETSRAENQKVEDRYEGGTLESQSLIGDGEGQYATLDALDAKVESLLSVYAGYPGVYGVVLADEPKNLYVKSYGEVYNSIKRVSEKNGWNIYPDFNLNPLNLTKLVYSNYYPYVEGTGGANATTGKATFEDGMARYQQYIENFMESMNPDVIQYDDYPLRNGYVSNTYIPCMQYIAQVAKERGIEFHMVTQTFDMRSNGAQSMTPLTEAGAHWLNNMLLGFGVREISYFTYYTNSENRSEGESFYDGGSSFMTLMGKPTRTYYIMKDIMAANQKFAPTLFQYDYQTSGVFTAETMNYVASHLDNVVCNQATYVALKNVEVNKECAMINELYDDEKDLYMYMAMNIVDPSLSGSPVYQTITLEFDEKYDYALVYRNGESGVYKLKNHTLNVKGAPGEASFVIPFNK